MVRDPRFISGIYNYCDRWCDRCPLKSRCMVFAQVRSRPEPVTFDDVADSVRDDLLQAMAMLREKADQLGIDLSAPLPPETVARDRAIRLAAEQHPLRRAADAYTRRARVLIEKFQKDGTEAAERPAADARPPRDDVRPRLSQDEAVRILGHYHFQIGSKLARALLWEPFDDEDERAVQNDANGSARVALLGIDRSIDAWFELLHFRAERTDIEAMLERLNALRDDVERVFPDARRFVRPGFDTGDWPWPDDAADGVRAAPGGRPA